MPLRFACPNCSKPLTVPDDRAGKKGTCPACKAAVTVPAVATPAPPSNPNPPYTLASWDQVDGVLDGLVEAVDRRLTDEEEDKVRAGLAGYAAAIPHHGIADLGKQVRITRVREHRAYRVVLDSLRERRQVARKQEPFAGTAPPAAVTTEATIRVWDYPHPTPDGFKKANAEHPVGDSRHVAACGPCGGQARVGCSACSATGTIPCSSCGGGGTQGCPQCRGSGQVTERRELPPEWGYCKACKGGVRDDGSRCWTCNGTGWLQQHFYQERTGPCLHCVGGQVACPACGRAGRVRCSPCAGTGQVACKTCKATGKMLNYLAVVQSFEPTTQAVPVSCPKLTDGAVAGLIREADYSPALTLGTDTCPPALALKSGVEPLRAAISKAFTAGLTPASADNRLVRQRLVVGAASVLEVGYECDGQAYTAWFAGRSLTAHVPASPVTAALVGMVKDAVRAWGEGDRKGATTLLREVMDMAEADTGCRRAYERVQHTIPTSLESKAKWVRMKPYFIAGGIAAAVFLVVAVVGIGYAVTKAKRGSTPQAAFDPRGADARPLAKENSVLLEFRSRSVTVPKGGTATLRLNITRLTGAGAADADVTVRLEAGRGLTVPAQVVVGRGQEQIEIEVRAGSEAGVFVLKAAVEGGDPILSAECRVSVGP